MSSPPDHFVVVPAVRAVSAVLALVCELADGKRFSVPFLLIGPTSQVRHAGDSGSLEVPDWFAQTHDLPTVR